MSTAKLQVATELLTEALRLFFEGTSYYAALHLAGAAEEVLAVYVRSHGGVSAFENTKNAVVRVSKFFEAGRVEANSAEIASILNHARNSTKHKFGKGDHYIDFDAAWEAEELLVMAVSDYYQLMTVLPLAETELIRRFNEPRSSALYLPPDRR